MAQAVLYPEQPKQADVTVENAVENAVVPKVVAALNVDDDGHKKNRIQVSNTKKPLFFYLNLAKRYMKQHNDVELSALGMAIPTLVTIAEILKANGSAVEKKVLTSTVGSKDENKGRVVQKAKLEIVLEKSANQKPASTATKTETNAPAEVKAETKPAADESKSDTKAAAADDIKPETKPAADEKTETNTATDAEKKEG